LVRYHFDTDFLVKALLSRGPEQTALRRISATLCSIEMSSIAWYEFSRGPRTPEQLARARALIDPEGIVGFAEAHAERAADVFRRLGSPRKRAADIAIACIALERNARLLSSNLRDYSGIDGLKLGAV
jgi:predicted nucleic acid-binding protein